MTAHRNNHSHQLNFVTRALVLVLVAIAHATVASAEVSRFKSNGAFASASATDGGCLWADVYVSRGGPASAPETYLGYSLYDACVSEYVAYGYGPVANSALQVSGNRAQLLVDVGGDPAFVTVGAVGRIDFKWFADKTTSYHWDGRSDYRTPTQRIMQRGSSDSNPAAASGTLIIMTFESGSGSVGTNKDMIREVIH